jgi:hypothetical protein
MKPTPWVLAEKYRIEHPRRKSKYGDPYGAFEIPFSTTGAVLRCLVTDGKFAQSHEANWAWDHVSVSTKKRMPNWIEMSFIKSVFWDDNETVMQLHVPVTSHINLHPNCLHLWRPIGIEIPLPPSNLV